MKRLLTLYFSMFLGGAFGDTLNITWMDGDSVHGTSSCTVGGNLVLPNAPTKRGYTFIGWGTGGIINGEQAVKAPNTQTPTNPIFPVFTPFGTDVLRAFKINGNLIADNYDTETGILTQKFGVKIFDGTENIIVFGQTEDKIVFIINRLFLDAANSINYGYVTHLPNVNFDQNINQMSMGAYINPQFSRLIVNMPKSVVSSVSEFKAWLATQYQNGTPMTVYYKLAEDIKTNWNPN